MVIDTRKNILKHNLKQMKLTDKEKKLLLFLSDNKPHTTREIRKYVGYLTDLQTSLFIRESSSFCPCGDSIIVMLFSFFSILS